MADDKIDYIVCEVPESGDLNPIKCFSVSRIWSDKMIEVEMNPMPFRDESPFAEPEKNEKKGPAFLQSHPYVRIPAEADTDDIREIYRRAVKGAPAGAVGNITSAAGPLKTQAVPSPSPV